MTFEIRQLHPLFVGEVMDVDLTRPISEATFSEIQRAIDRDAVLVFHGEALSEERQIAFSTHFGPISGPQGVLQTNIKRRVSDQT
jgi:alpha-ketoglutarate-dependent 2,4-dichlorophenoxyacetate dioxygenase